jgi:hypothetical protein
MFPDTPPPATDPYTTAQGILDALIEGYAKVTIEGIAIDSVIVEAPGVHENYETIVGTINNGLSNISIPLGDVSTGYAVSIINKTQDTLITMKLNGTDKDAINITNDINLGLLGVNISNLKFDSVHLSNASGENVDYEIIIKGV